jgi:Permeases
MSQQHTTQTSGQGLLERVFKLREHGTTARTEVIAGFTTFLTMVYIVFVNPQILGVAGMDTSAVFVTTCLIAALGSILMGVFANLPVALAPAMGLNRSLRSWWFRRWACRGRLGWALFSGARSACCC